MFLAKDVAELLGHSNLSKMISDADLSEGETHITSSYGSGGIRQMMFLTEDGLYEILMQSRKPIAKEFKKQVKEILKEIRQDVEYC